MSPLALPYNPAKFIPTVQTKDTGAAGAGTTQASAPSAAQTDTTAVSKFKAPPTAYVRTSGTGFTVSCASEKELLVAAIDTSKY